jgi:hypothetical protein
MSSLQDEYYKKKAYKYFIKYTQLKLRGGAQPEWYEILLKESIVIYQKLPIVNNTIILSGSAAIALLLGNAGIDLRNAFIDPLDSSKNTRPKDLDFIYQGSTKNDNINLSEITVQLPNSSIVKYKRKEDRAISSNKYIIDSKQNVLIQDFDLTNVNTNYKETKIRELPYIIINGIKVLTPEKLLSFYEDESLEKDTYKIQELSNFVERIKRDPLLKEKYTPLIKEEPPVSRIRPNLFSDPLTTPPVSKKPRSMFSPEDD